jgi:GST-like protein
MIDLHNVGTPNGTKVMIILEELALSYSTIEYNLLAGDHLRPEFRRLNPNHKLPVLTDHEPGDGGPPISIAESGVILVYLAEKTGKLLSTELRRRTLTMQWLMWQMSGVGPMNGQAHHFIRYAPESEVYSVQRYRNEARRLLGVLENRLHSVEYLAEEYSIADIAVWPWVRTSKLIDIDLSEFSAVESWIEKIGKRDAVIRATTGKNAPPDRIYQKRMTLTREEWSNFFGENMLRASSAHANE